MLRISKLTDYATLVMVALAENHGSRLPAVRVAEITQLEIPTVAKILKILARSELVQSFRGVSGGYSLACRPEEISIAAVIRAMEGPIALTECSLEPGLCAHESSCQLRGNWQRIGVVVESALEKLSVHDMMSSPAPRITVVAEPERSGAASPATES